MSICTRCHRAHSGICGIPPGVVLGFGARIGGARINSRDTLTGFSAGSKQDARTKRSSTGLLEHLLEQSKAQEKKVLDMLKVVPSEMAEYVELVDRLDKVQTLIHQLEGQLAERS